MSNETKTGRIKNWLEDGKHLSAILAIQMFDCMDLRGVIHRLRASGMQIQSFKRGNYTTYYIEKEND